MKLKVDKKQLPDLDHDIRRLGYVLHLDRRTGEKSFVRRLERGLFFPRFHLYLEDAGDNWSLNLHLDQRAPIYQGVKAHSGEYDGHVVEQELSRINEAIKKSN